MKNSRAFVWAVWTTIVILGTTVGCTSSESINTIKPLPTATEDTSEPTETVPFDDVSDGNWISHELDIYGPDNPDVENLLVIDHVGRVREITDSIDIISSSAISYCNAYVHDRNLKHPENLSIDNYSWLEEENTEAALLRQLVIGWGEVFDACVEDSK